MDTKTTYLGLELAHPLMPGASPLVDKLDTVRALEDAGAAAIVMHSLFEEQIRREELTSVAHLHEHGESFAEAMSYMPADDAFVLGPAEYLEQLSRIKAAVAVPVIGSLNGSSATGWLEYARLIEQAGADALELNVYHVASDPLEAGEEVEERVLAVLRTVRESVHIPLAVKLSPYYSSVSHLARRLEEAGADGLVVFNRFYQPELDIEALEVVPALHLSSSAELALRLQWVAILSGQIKGSLAVTGGVHDGLDAVRAVMAGAHAVQLVSALLRHGPKWLGYVLKGLVEWLEAHEYDSLRQAQGALSTRSCPDPTAFERGNYLRTLQSWRQ